MSCEKPFIVSSDEKETNLILGLPNDRNNISADSSELSMGRINRRPPPSNTSFSLTQPIRSVSSASSIDFVHSNLDPWMNLLLLMVANKIVPQIEILVPKLTTIHLLQEE